LQRQHQQRQQMGLPEVQLSPEQRHQVDTVVDAIPSLTEHQKRFLKSHPSLLHEPYLTLMRHAVLLARHAGIPEDTAEFDHAILAGVAKDIQHHAALQALTSPGTRPTPQNAQAHQDTAHAAADLAREAQMHLAAEQPAPLSPQRRSVPVSAPVSRAVPLGAGQSRPGQKHLSADERQIAHISFPHLSETAAELEYIKNRDRMHAMKADGRIDPR